MENSASNTCLQGLQFERRPRELVPHNSIHICLCRTLERIINKKVLHHLETNDILSTAQHGFRPGRSCETALCTVTHTVSAHRDNRTPCELVQLDFSKEFDKINHQLLLHKLHNAGIRGNLLLWLQCFITGRSQQVVFGGVKSPSCTVISGVPQGSVLGPTLSWFTSTTSLRT